MNQPNRPSAQHDRRRFLKHLAAGALAAAATRAPQPASAADAEPRANVPAPLGPVPMITVAGQRIARMVIGSNPIGGWSHQVRALTNAMLDYFTLDNITRFLSDCERAGLTTFICPFAEKPLKAMRTLREQGSKLRPYFLGELGRDGKISKDIMEHKPLYYVHHGNVTDALFRAGKHELVHDFLKQVHDVLGIGAGVSAHNPDCIKYVEDKGWECDFYQCCMYYITRPKNEIRAKLGGAPLGEPFLDSDRETMMKVIQQVSKPCLAFKILGAGWHCDSDRALEDAFEYALTNIKKTDGVIVGMWPKFKDEITQNVKLLQRYGAIA